MPILSSSDDEYTMVYELDSLIDGVPTRKRQRLTHLSPSEKLQRRKLKNRVAAQAARDRKKAHMDDIEVKLADLLQENARLRQENAILRNSHPQNICPNCQSQQTTDEKQPLSGTASVEPVSDKSAALTPQQKDQMQALLALVITCCSVLSLTASSNSSECLKLSQKETTRYAQITHPSQIYNRVANEKWWGPQQSSWNPSKRQ